jgi:Protein of unknown function (DUF1569)
MKTLARHRDKTALLARLRTVRPESVARWGRMSAHQMVCHLSDALRMATGQRPVSHTGGLLDRTIIKWIVLYLPLPWPKDIATRPEIDQEQGGTRPLDFAADVAQLEALMELTTRPSTCDRQRHPVFGRMSETAWLRWAYLHADHHLRQFGV